jgi:hypothetical protein
VETRLGTLESFDGMPLEGTAATLLEHLTFLRGVEAFLNTIPAASLEAIRVGLESVGATTSNQVVIFDELMDANPLFLTGNTDMVYALAILVLSEVVIRYEREVLRRHEVASRSERDNEERRR